MMARALDLLALLVVLGCVVALSLGVRGRLASGPVDPETARRIDAIGAAASGADAADATGDPNDDPRFETAVDRLEERLRRVEQRAERLR